MKVNSSNTTTTTLTLRIWHPDCWTLECTAAVDAELVVHDVHAVDGRVNARLTASADAPEDIEETVAVIDDSRLTDGVEIVTEYVKPDVEPKSIGGDTEELLVKYDSDNSIYDAFISRGFEPTEEIRVHDGHEFWTVEVSDSTKTVQSRLDEIRDEMRAEITVEAVRSLANADPDRRNGSSLSERQREVFSLAQQRGYYRWPREVSASELADELDVSKTTLLEHLRKAEAKLLGPQ